MATLKKSDAAQTVLAQQFIFNYDDTMVNTGGTSTAFGAVNSAYAYDVIDLPVGAVIVGGNVIVDTAFTTAGTATLAVGTSSDSNVYSNNTTIDLESAGITAITPEAADGGVVGSSRATVRITLTNSNNAISTGKVYINILYVVEKRADEVVS